MRQPLLIITSMTAAVLGLTVSALSAYFLPHIPLIWQISLGVGAASTLAYLFLERRLVKTALGKRTVRYGLNSLFMSIVVLFIVVFINLIASQYDLKKDITRNQIHMLSEQSIKFLKGLNFDVTIRAFVYPNQTQQYDKIFEKYTYQTKHLKRVYIDPDKDVLLMQEQKITSPNTMIVESSARSVRIDTIHGPDDVKIEEKLTNAIIQVAKGEKKKIYFLTGHGERLLTDSNSQGYSQIKEALEGSRFKVESFSLLDKDRIPEDTEILIVAGPKSEFMEYELKLIDAYARSGGKVLFLIDPDASKSLKPFLAKFGVEWKPSKTIFETNPLQMVAGGNPFTPVVQSYDTSHEITRDVRSENRSIFAIASPIEKSVNAPTDFKISSLFSTSPVSYEVELVGEKAKLNRGNDRKGPLSLALAISGKATKGTKGTPEKTASKVDKKDTPPKADEVPEKEQEFRLIVVGDSDFVSNGLRKYGYNSDLFQNMLSWLAKEEELIAVRPKPADVSEFDITDERVKIIKFASIVFAPFGLFLLGTMVWISRKRR